MTHPGTTTPVTTVTPRLTPDAATEAVEAVRRAIQRRIALDTPPTPALLAAADALTIALAAHANGCVLSPEPVIALIEPTLGRTPAGPAVLVPAGRTPIEAATAAYDLLQQHGVTPAGNAVIEPARAMHLTTCSDLDHGLHVTTRRHQGDGPTVTAVIVTFDG